jgi:hypothetical protein
MRLIIVVSLLIFSSVVFAEKILITGKPVELEVNKGNYTFPDTYIDRNKGYHYILLMRIERVCFLREISSLENLDKISILIVDDKRTLPWTCYRYNPNFFVKGY